MRLDPSLDDLRTLADAFYDLVWLRYQRVAAASWEQDHATWERECERLVTTLRIDAGNAAVVDVREAHHAPTRGYHPSMTPALSERVFW